MDDVMFNFKQKVHQLCQEEYIRGSVAAYRAVLYLFDKDFSKEEMKRIIEEELNVK